MLTQISDSFGKVVRNKRFVTIATENVENVAATTTGKSQNQGQATSDKRTYSS